MLNAFNQRARHGAASLSLAALAGLAFSPSANAAPPEGWWMKPGLLPATSSLRLQTREVNVRSITGMVNREIQCEINGATYPLSTGVIPDTGHFYGIALSNDRQCGLVPLVSIKPANPATAQELMTTIAQRAPKVAAVLQGRGLTGIAQLDQAMMPKQVPGLGFVVPAEATLGYALTVGLQMKAEASGAPIPSPCTSTGPDTDGDGIPDAVERNGALDLDGTRFRSNQFKADSDDDGLTDADEIGEPLSYAEAQKRATARGLNPATLDPQACYYDVYSNPLNRDTDGDLLEDALELDFGSNPRKPDTDGDGLSDAGERLWGTDPTNPDTDGDGYSDKVEAGNEDLGYNPLVPDPPLLKTAYLAAVESGAEAAKGGICGDVCELDSLPELVGAMAFSVMPVAGTVGDLRDTFANTIKGNYVNAALAMTGIIPVGGDAARLGNMAASFLRKHPEQLEPVLQIISRGDFIPDKMRSSVLKRAFTGAAEATYHGLTVRHGISEQTLARLSRNSRHMKMRDLLKALDDCGGCIRRDVAGYSNDGWMKLPVDAEKHLRAGRDTPITLPPEPRKRTDVRRYDDLNNRIAREAKSGYVVADSRTMRQIEKDCSMLAHKQKPISGIEWHFYASNDSHSIGAAQEVLNALKGCKNGPIPFYFHIP